jgi:hypothetical protein
MGQIAKIEPYYIITTEMKRKKELLRLARMAA